MVRSINPMDNKPFINVLGNLHLNLANALENIIYYIQCRQDTNKDDEDLVHIHMVLLHIY
jgi:hypothetical protein